MERRVLAEVELPLITNEVAKKVKLYAVGMHDKLTLIRKFRTNTGIDEVSVKLGIWETALQGQVDVTHIGDCDLLFMKYYSVNEYDSLIKKILAVCVKNNLTKEDLDNYEDTRKKFFSDI